MSTKHCYAYEEVGNVHVYADYMDCLHEEDDESLAPVYVKGHQREQAVIQIPYHVFERAALGYFKARPDRALALGVTVPK